MQPIGPSTVTLEPPAPPAPSPSRDTGLELPDKDLSRELSEPEPPASGPAELGGTDPAKAEDVRPIGATTEDRLDGVSRGALGPPQSDTTAGSPRASLDSLAPFDPASQPAPVVPDTFQSPSASSGSEVRGLLSPPSEGPGREPVSEPRALETSAPAGPPDLKWIATEVPAPASPSGGSTDLGSAGPPGLDNASEVKGLADHSGSAPSQNVDSAAGKSEPDRARAEPSPVSGSVPSTAVAGGIAGPAAMDGFVPMDKESPRYGLVLDNLTADFLALKGAQPALSEDTKPATDAPSLKQQPDENDQAKVDAAAKILVHTGTGHYTSTGTELKMNPDGDCKIAVYVRDTTVKAATAAGIQVSGWEVRYSPKRVGIDKESRVIYVTDALIGDCVPSAEDLAAADEARRISAAEMRQNINARTEGRESAELQAGLAQVTSGRVPGEALGVEDPERAASTGEAAEVTLEIKKAAEEVLARNGTSFEQTGRGDLLLTGEGDGEIERFVNDVQAWVAAAAETGEPEWTVRYAPEEGVAKLDADARELNVSDALVESGVPSNADLNAMVAMQTLEKETGELQQEFQLAAASRLASSALETKGAEEPSVNAQGIAAAGEVEAKAAELLVRQRTGFERIPGGGFELVGGDRGTPIDRFVGTALGLLTEAAGGEASGWSVQAIPGQGEARLDTDNEVLLVSDEMLRRGAPTVQEAVALAEALDEVRQATRAGGVEEAPLEEIYGDGVTESSAVASTTADETGGGEQQMAAEAMGTQDRLADADNDRVPTSREGGDGDAGGKERTLDPLTAARARYQEAKLELEAAKRGASDEVAPELPEGETAERVTAAEWRVAERAQALLAEAGLPYSTSLGVGGRGDGVTGRPEMVELVERDGVYGTGHSGYLPPASWTAAASEGPFGQLSTMGSARATAQTAQALTALGQAVRELENAPADGLEAAERRVADACTAAIDKMSHARSVAERGVRITQNALAMVRSVGSRVSVSGQTEEEMLRHGEGLVTVTITDGRRDQVQVAVRDAEAAQVLATQGEITDPETVDALKAKAEQQLSLMATRSGHGVSMLSTVASLVGSVAPDSPSENEGGNSSGVGSSDPRAKPGVTSGERVIVNAEKIVDAVKVVRGAARLFLNRGRTGPSGAAGERPSSRRAAGGGQRRSRSQGRQVQSPGLRTPGP